MNMASVVEKCLRAGKNVISEKPIAGTYEDAVKLYQRYCDEFHSQGLMWAINENWAFEPYFLRVSTHSSFNRMLGKKFLWTEA